jgi:hypothetical protein
MAATLQWWSGWFFSGQGDAPELPASPLYRLLDPAPSPAVKVSPLNYSVSG